MQQDELVRMLVDARKARIPVPMPSIFAEGLSVSQAYGLQRRHISAVLEDIGGHEVGIKLGGGSLESQAKLGLTGPFRGPIFSALTCESPARLRRGDFCDLCLIEPEIAFLMAKDVDIGDAPPDRDLLVSAIGAIVLSIEVADSRYSDFSSGTPAAIIADLVFAGAWVRGPQIDDWRNIPLDSLRVRLFNGDAELRDSVGGHAMGDPLIALVAAAADLWREGRGLKAGQIVSAGSFTPGYLAQRGDALVADFGALGQVSLTLD